VKKASGSAERKVGKKAGKNGRRKRRSRYPETETYTLSDLGQIKVLADPLRLRLLEAFCQERTTKQVATLIDEKPTKLYHHVEALERVGLIRLSRKRQVRGTVEKYYMAVARVFQADSRLFAAADNLPEGQETFQTMVSTVLDRTSGDLRKLIADGQATQVLKEEGIFSHVEIRASEKEIRRLRTRFHRLLKDLQKTCCGDDVDEQAEDGPRYRLTLAFYPLGPEKTS
jgi:DNA-binding transcriptional ArsR family regulator